MDLKELLGEELYNQVIEKAGDNKLAIVSDGNWFPKDKFDAKNDEVKDLKQQLKDRDKQLNDLSEKAKDNEELTATIEQLKEDNKTATDDLQQKLDQQAFDFSLEKALTGAKVRNPKAVKALLDTDIIKLKDDELTGLNEQLEQIKESDPYLFEEEQQKGDPKPNFTTGQHKKGGSGEPSNLGEALAQHYSNN